MKWRILVRVCAIFCFYLFRPCCRLSFLCKISNKEFHSLTAYTAFHKLIHREVWTLRSELELYGRNVSFICLHISVFFFPSPVHETLFCHQWNQHPVNHENVRFAWTTIQQSSHLERTQVKWCFLIPWTLQNIRTSDIHSRMAAIIQWCFAGRYVCCCCCYCASHFNIRSFTAIANHIIHFVNYISFIIIESRS